VVAPREDVGHVEETGLVHAGHRTPRVVAREHRVAERCRQRPRTDSRLILAGLVLPVPTRLPLVRRSVRLYVESDESVRPIPEELDLARVAEVLHLSAERLARRVRVRELVAEHRERELQERPTFEDVGFGLLTVPSEFSPDDAAPARHSPGFGSADLKASVAATRIRPFGRDGQNPFLQGACSLVQNADRRQE
jgi:hypothetical protein